MERPDIYEYFAEKLGCFVSDLRMGSHVDWEPEWILSVPDTLFSPEEWQDFIRYACNAAPLVSSAGEGKADLISRKCPSEKKK